MVTIRGEIVIRKPVDVADKKFREALYDRFVSRRPLHITISYGNRQSRTLRCVITDKTAGADMTPESVYDLYEFLSLKESK